MDMANCMYRNSIHVGTGVYEPLKDPINISMGLTARLNSKTTSYVVRVQVFVEHVAHVYIF